MKKILFILCICVSFGVFSTTSYAGKCEGGVEFPGLVNNHTYCRSKVGMTWWAAFAWCKKQGRELASVKQICDSNGATSAGQCDNVAEGVMGWLWSANPKSSTSAFRISKETGSIQGGNVNDTNQVAICY